MLKRATAFCEQNIKRRTNNSFCYERSFLVPLLYVPASFFPSCLAVHTHLECTDAFAPPGICIAVGMQLKRDVSYLLLFTSMVIILQWLRYFVLVSLCTCGFTLIKQLVERVDIIYGRIKLKGEGRQQQQLQTCGLMPELLRMLCCTVWPEQTLLVKRCITRKPGIAMKQANTICHLLLQYWAAR